MTKLTVGCDPEFFLYDKQQGMFVSAHEMIPGTKRKPHKVKNGAIQVDGTAVEFNTDPSSTPEEFASNVESVLGQLREIIPSRYEFKFLPSVEFDEAYFKALPEKVLELGCDPDFRCMLPGEVAANPPPEAYGTLRTGSGHLHFGWTSDKSSTDLFHKLDCETIVVDAQAAFQNYLKEIDTDKRRQNMYGKSHTFRYKSYGVEYRTPSNAWLRYPDIWPWVFQMCKYVFDNNVNGNYTYYLETTSRKRDPNTVIEGLSKDAKNMSTRYSLRDYPLLPSSSKIKEW